MAKDRDLRAGRSMATEQRRPGDFENGRHREAYRDENEGREWIGRGESEGPEPLGIVRRNPLTAVMTGFALGLGFGLAMTLLITRRERSWYQENIAGTLQNLPERLRHVPDSIGAYVPTAWKRW